MTSYFPINTRVRAEEAYSGKLKAVRKTIAITSGKGGVGKTLTTVNFAMAARNMGYEVMILDADLGLANVDVLLGISGRYSLQNVIDGEVSINEVVLSGPNGIQVIPSGSGVASMANLTSIQRVALMDAFAELNRTPDILLIDTGAGISENVMHFNQVADDVVVVTTPEPHAMADAYATIKVLSENSPKTKINLLVNMTKHQSEGRKVFERIAEVSQRFLNKQIQYSGSVPTDPNQQRYVAARRAVGESSVRTAAGQSWNQIARDLLANVQTGQRPGKADSVWQEMLWPQNASFGSMTL